LLTRAHPHTHMHTQTHSYTQGSSISNVPLYRSDAANNRGVVVSSYTITSLAVAKGDTSSQTQTSTRAILPNPTMLPPGAVVGGQNARAIVQLSCGMPFLPAISSANFTTYMIPFTQQMAQTVRDRAIFYCTLCAAHFDVVCPRLRFTLGHLPTRRAYHFRIFPFAFSTPPRALATLPCRLFRPSTFRSPHLTLCLTPIRFKI
jgi:hypothetical protein